MFVFFFKQQNIQPCLHAVLQPILVEDCSEVSSAAVKVAGS